MKDAAYDDIIEGPLSFSIMIRLAGLAFLFGAVVGQLVDFSYTLFGALEYYAVTIHILSPYLDFCWWIPVLYGSAGVILWIGYVLLDRKFKQKPRGGFNPTWRFIIIAILLYALQTYGGPFLHSVGVSNFWLPFIMISTATLIWWVFDRTYAGLIMFFLAAILGPLLEYNMINVFHLYHYTRPDIFGLPIWITGAYMSGAAPNGNLARKFLLILQKHKLKSKELVKEKDI